MVYRFILEYIDRKTRTLQEENVALKWTLCCIKCCMWCLEKIMVREQTPHITRVVATPFRMCVSDRLSVQVCLYLSVYVCVCVCVCV